MPKISSQKQLEELVGSIIADKLGKAQAELALAMRAKAREDNDTPEGRDRKARKTADEARAKSDAAIERAKFGDSIANKDMEELTNREKCHMFARALQCQYQAEKNGNPGAAGAIEIAKAAGQGTLVKNMQASDFNQGGFLLPEALASAVIKELIANVVYLKAGPRKLTLPPGGLSLPYESDAIDSSWTAEGSEANADTPEGGRIQLSPKKLVTICGVSNDLLRSEVGSMVDDYIVDTIIAGMESQLDSALLRSNGVSNEPMGLYSLAPSGQKYNVTAEASITTALLMEELLHMDYLITTNNINRGTANFARFVSPRTETYLRTRQDTFGKLFPEIDNGQLLGASLGVTSNIPDNLGSSSDESEIYTVAMRHMIVAEGRKLEVDMMPGAAYRTSAGAIKSSFSADETPIRVIGSWDHAAGQRGNEIAVAEQVDWVTS